MILFKKRLKTEDGILLDKKSSEEIRNLLKVSNFLTFLSYRPYRSPDRSRQDIKDVRHMFNLGKNCEEHFNFFVNHNEDISLFSTDYVKYLALYDGWFDLVKAYKSFLEDYNTIDVGKHHEDRLLTVLQILEENNINIFELKHFSGKKYLANVFGTYEQYFSLVKKKKKIKTPKKVKLLYFAISISIIFYYYVLN